MILCSVFSAVYYASCCCVPVISKTMITEPQQNSGLSLSYNNHAVCIIYNCIRLLLKSDYINIGRDECIKGKCKDNTTTGWSFGTDIFLLYNTLIHLNILKISLSMVHLTMIKIRFKASKLTGICKKWFEEENLSYQYFH